jgi:transketolase
LASDYQFSYGKGTVLCNGKDAVLFSYGPVMLNEALTAATLLQDDGFSLKVVNLPWLNRVDVPWLEETVGACDNLIVLDDHSQYGGLGDCLLNACMSSGTLRGKQLLKFAIEDHPACGTPQEVLDYHRVSGRCLAPRILEAVRAEQGQLLEAAS